MNTYKTFLHILLAAALSCTALGCATSKDVEAVERQVASINAELRTVKGNLDEITFALKAQNAALDKLEGIKDDQAQATRDLKEITGALTTVKRNQADLGNKVSNMTGGEIMTVGGQIDELRHGMEATNAKLDALKATLLQKLDAMGPGRPASPETQAAPEARTGGEAGAQTIEPTKDEKAPAKTPEDAVSGDASGPPPVNDPMQMYQAAYLDYTKGNYELALMGFRDYLKAFPDAEFAGNAQYWTGESLYSLGRYEDAVVEFQGVMAKYPDSNKVPGAMLKKGLCYEALGKPDEAKAALGALVSKYPNSEAAKLAKQRMTPKTRGKVPGK